MDAQRTSFVLAIAVLFAAPALAAPPSESAPVRYDWGNGSTTAPTITASPNNRYTAPQATRAQAPATSGYPAQPSNSPFAVQPAAPPANTATRTNLAPPPAWPTNTSTLAPPPTTNWGSSTPVTPVDRSMLAAPAAPQSNGDWTSIGSTIAAPPMLLPQSPASTTSLAPLNSTNTSSFDNGPSFTTNSYPGTSPSFGSSSVNSTSQTSPAPASRPATTSDNWAGSWDGNSSNNTSSFGNASIGSSTNNNSLRPVTPRDAEFPSSSRVATNQQDTRNAPARTDSWTDDSSSRTSPWPSAPPASSGGSRPATIGSAGNTAPAIQPPLNAPPTIGSAGNNMNFNGANPYAPQQPTTVNVAKPTQGGGPNGEPQQWATLMFALIALAGSIAGNVYLGWSYMDARQKYQALVRRTADTFRRTKVAA